MQETDFVKLANNDARLILRRKLNGATTRHGLWGREWRWPQMKKIEEKL